MKAAHGKGHTTKHARALKTKHHATAKHHPAKTAKSAVKHKTTVHTKAKHATHAKAKGLALAPGDVACCTTEALAVSLRLAGLAVTDAQMLELFRLAGGHEDKGLPLSVALEAAAAFGLAGRRLAVADPGRVTCAGLAIPDHHRHLILGLELPGQHAALATADGWWSWGELWCPCEFPGAVIDEAWAIEWAVTA